MENYGLSLEISGTPDRIIVDIKGEYVCAKLYSMIKHEGRFGTWKWGNLKIMPDDQLLYFGTNVTPTTSPRFSPESDNHLHILSSSADFESGFRIDATGNEWTVETMNPRPLPATSESVFLSGLFFLARKSVSTQFNTCLQRLHPTFRFLEGNEARVCYLVERGASKRLVPTDQVNGREKLAHGSALMARLKFKHKVPTPHSNFHFERDDDSSEDDEPGVKGVRKVEIEVQFLGKYCSSLDEQ